MFNGRVALSLDNGKKIDCLFYRPSKNLKIQKYDVDGKVVAKTFEIFFTIIAKEIFE